MFSTSWLYFRCHQHGGLWEGIIGKLLNIYAQPNDHPARCRFAFKLSVYEAEDGLDEGRLDHSKTCTRLTSTRRKRYVYVAHDRCIDNTQASEFDAFHVSDMARIHVIEVQQKQYYIVNDTEFLYTGLAPIRN
jgi:hypothetical protein